MDDWQRSTLYTPAPFAESIQVKWFWATVRAFSQVEQTKLLLFCTGSARTPAQGFGALPEYNGRQGRFTVRQVKSASRLPTASSCFNTLYLPMYKSEADLRSNLHFALNEAEGFYEGAAA